MYRCICFPCAAIYIIDCSLFEGFKHKHLAETGDSNVFVCRLDVGLQVPSKVKCYMPSTVMLVCILENFGVGRAINAMLIQAAG